MSAGVDRVGVHARLFRWLLRLYPAAFRDAYGDEMSEFFLARLERARERRGAVGVAAFWSRTVGDVARTAFAEHRTARAHGIRPRRSAAPMSSLLQDLGYAARRLRHTMLFTLSAVAILAVGIGLNATVFSLVDALLLRPPPFSDPESIVHIYQDSDDGDPSSTSFPAYRDMAAMTDVFAAVAATSTAGATWEMADGPQQVAVEYATASYLPVFGLSPQRGRWFSAVHDQVGAEMVAVVSDRTWRARMGADADVIGRTIHLNNQPVTIIGIGPENFNGEAGALVTDFWLSISSVRVGGAFRVANLERREDHWYQVKARLAPGASVQGARVAMNALALHLADAYPELNRGRNITVFAHDEVRFHPDADGPLRTASVGLFTVAALVLLLACSNLGNLLLVRGIARRSEVAVRLALGAGRVRVMRLLLFEALLLSAAGAAAGLVLAGWSLRIIPGLPLPIPGAGLDIGIDVRVVTFSVLLALATSLFFGLLPSLRATRTDIAASLRDEGRGRSAGRNVSLLRGGLLTLQVAVSLVLVVGAGLLTRSLANIQRVDPGVDVERIAVLGTHLEQGGVTDAEGAVVVSQVLERVEALPGVERAALTTRLPVQSSGTTTQVVDGYEPAAGTGSVELDFAVVSRGYFTTMGIPLLAGRGFTADDRPESPRVIVVNETAARVFWGGTAIGRRIRSQSVPDGWREVVGVVADTRVSRLDEAPVPLIYYSAEQAGVTSFQIVARTAGDPALLLGPLRTALRDVRPTLPVTRLLTLDRHLGDALVSARMIASLMTAFSLLALLLAALGVYAIVSFSVEQRAPELGIRSALGASRPRLIGMVVGETLVIVMLGVCIGLAVALLATRGLEGMLYGVGSFDPATFGTAAVLLLTAAAASAFIPALRAARADPVEVLHHA
jgi:putative ABC transport system permease protein